MKPIPSNAKVLFVGLDPAGAECLRRLVVAGVKNFTILHNKSLDAQDLSENPWLPSASIGQPAAKVIAAWLSGQSPELTVEARVEDLQAIITKSPDFVISFSLVLMMRVAREIELAFGKVLYEAPHCALIISRSDEFHAKMRSQYRIHQITDEPGDVVLEGIDLIPRPEPPTPEKCNRVSKAVAASIDVSSPEILSWLLVIYATGTIFKATQGYPAAHRPAAVSLAGHEAEVEAIMRNTIVEKGLKGVVIDTEAIRICCGKGWGGLCLTATIMGALIAGEGIKLLTNTGRPVNCVPADLAAVATLGIPVEF